VCALSGQDAAHRLHRGARCGEGYPPAPRVTSRTAADCPGPGAARHPRALPRSLNAISAVDDPCVDGSGASGTLEIDDLTPTRQVFSGSHKPLGRAALLVPVPKVALFFLSAHSSDSPP
jgi:hypothetical protein